MFRDDILFAHFDFAKWMIGMNALDRNEIEFAIRMDSTERKAKREQNE